MSSIFANMISIERPTSEFLLLVSVPTAPCFSTRTVEVPSRPASCLAIARPTTPAPITFEWKPSSARPLVQWETWSLTAWVKSACRGALVENNRCVCIAEFLRARASIASHAIAEYRTLSTGNGRCATRSRYDGWPCHLRLAGLSR